MFFYIFGLIPFLPTYAREGERKHLDHARYEPGSVVQLANTQTVLLGIVKYLHYNLFFEHVTYILTLSFY